MTFILLAKCLSAIKKKKTNAKYCCCCQKLNRSGTRGKIFALNGGLNVSSNYQTHHSASEVTVCSKGGGFTQFLLVCP